MKALGWLIVIPIVIVCAIVLAFGIAGIAAIVYIFASAASAVF